MIGTSTGRPAVALRAALTIGLLLLVVASAAGCSDDSGESNTTNAADATNESAPPPGSPDGGVADVPDPCSLLTIDDLETATGVSFGDGAFNDTLSSEAQAICDWAAVDADFATVQTLLAPDTGGFDANRRSTDAAVGPVRDIEIPGADSAFESVEGSIVGMVVGDLFLQVSYIPAVPGDVSEATEQLATTAVANL